MSKTMTAEEYLQHPLTERFTDRVVANLNGDRQGLTRRINALLGENLNAREFNAITPKQIDLLADATSAFFLWSINAYEQDLAEVTIALSSIQILLLMVFITARESVTGSDLPECFREFLQGKEI